jgi:hypothetical protein
MGDALKDKFISGIEIMACPAAGRGRNWWHNNTGGPNLGGSSPSCLTLEYAQRYNPYWPADGTWRIRVCSFSYRPLDDPKTTNNNSTLAAPRRRHPLDRPLVADWLAAWDWHGRRWNCLYKDGHVKTQLSEGAYNMNFVPPGHSNSGVRARQIWGELYKHEP